MMTPVAVSTPELEAALRAAGSGAAAWLDTARRKLGALDAIGTRALYAAAGRTARGLAVPELVVPQSEHWTAVDWVRLWIAGSALELTPPPQQLAALLVLFDGGELGEQVSLLRTLGALPDAGRFVDVGVAACRTNATSVFEAIACENPFAALYFPALNFNQLVMKAVFMNVPLSRVVGLAERSNDELARMASDFAAERRAAGRPIPDDLALIAPGLRQEE